MPSLGPPAPYGVWTADLDQQVAREDGAALVVTCRGRRLLVVTSGAPARLIGTNRLAPWMPKCLDATGVYRWGTNDYLPDYGLHCKQHKSLSRYDHELSIPLLVAEWQQVDPRRKSARVVDVSRVLKRADKG